MTAYMPKNESSKKYWGWFIAGIFVLAVVLRLLHLFAIYNSPFFSILLGDAQSYDGWAQEIAGGDWLGDKVFYQAPLYPYFLGVLYTIFGRNFIVVRLIQAITGALSCVLIASACRRFFSRAAGVVAGVIMAVYAPAIFFDGLIGKTSLDILFVSLMLWLLSRLITEQRKYLWFCAGLVMGCLGLTRENALVLVLPVLLWLWFGYRALGVRRLVFGGVFVLGLVIVLFPVAIRNKITGGGFHLTTSQFGPNFYYGNNENANGTYRPLRYGRGHPEHEREDATEIAEQAIGKKLTSKEVSRYWAGRAMEYITSQPLDWLRLKVRTFALLCNATEIVDTEDQYTYADWSMPLRLTGFACHFGVIGPLALFGVFVTRQKRDKLRLLYLMVIIYTVSVVMFFVLARFRYLLVPFAVMFASAGLVESVDFLRKSSRLRITVCLAATVGAGIFCNWPMMPKDIMRATTYVNLGAVFQSEGKVDEAVNQYHLALKAKGDFVVAHHNLGIVLQSQVKVEEAIEHYLQALRVKNDYAEAHYNLGTALKSLGRVDEAISCYRRATGIRPEYIEAHNSLGIALQSQGKTDEAIKHYYKILEIRPDYADAHYNLGNAFKSQGRFDDAAKHYRKALESKANDAEAHNNLGIVLKSQGKFDEAVFHYRQSLRIKPDYVKAHNNLAAALVTHPDPQKRDIIEAVKSAKRAAELTKYQNATILSTLATVYAAGGRFAEAIDTAERALELALSVGNSKLANHISKQLKLYKQAKP